MILLGGEQSLGTGYGDGRFLACGLALAGISAGLGGIQFNQGLSRFHPLAVLYQNSADGSGIQWLNHLDLRVGNQLAFGCRYHIQLAKDRPQCGDEGE